MKQRCRHDVKIEIMINLFKPATIGFVKQNVRIGSRKLNKILDDLIERRLVLELRNKDGTILYHTTPHGKKIVKLYKDLSDNLEGKDALQHIFGTYI